MIKRNKLKVFAIIPIIILSSSSASASWLPGWSKGGATAPADALFSNSVDRRLEDQTPKLLEKVKQLVHQSTIHQNDNNQKNIHRHSGSLSWESTYSSGTPPEGSKMQEASGVSSANDLGYMTVSAGGDNKSDYTIWLRGIMSSMKHEASDTHISDKYSVKSRGVYLGLSKTMNDGNLIGASYHYIIGDKRSPGLKHNNKDHSFVLNGNFYLTDKLYLMGIGMYTGSKITGDDLGTSGIEMNIYSTVGKLGYNINLGNDFSLTPRLGVKYTRVSRATHTNALKTKFKSLTSSKVDMIASTTLQKTYTYDDFQVLGQFFADVHRTVSSRSDEIQFTIVEIAEEITLPMSLAKSTHYSLGAKTVAKIDNFCISASYAYSFAHKESGHTGSLGAYIEF
ncbi:autotransporter outer membrane beta-barrel domain-containing protein [Rickettsiaceae bacterium]|nr:autotransporter outer membrane beta-barrel domain-containing protein [Rickettsiaceae bacterium]